MPQKISSYRPTPTSPMTATPQPTSSAIEDLDDFLDEVDAMLETNALETLRAYTQRGGQ